MIAKNVQMFCCEDVSLIEDGVKYTEIAAAFNMSLASIKKFGQALKHNTEQKNQNA